jgi:3-oxoadipate enol-lactonase
MKMLDQKGYEFCFEGIVDLEDSSLYVIRTRPLNNSKGQIIFLGGSNFDLRIKKAFLASSILTEYEFVTYEPRGIHRSSVPDGDWSMSDFSNDAQDLMKWLGWENVVILGESFGGMTALHLSIDCPEKILAMAISSATPGGAGGSSLSLLPMLGLEIEEFSRKMLLQQDSRLSELAKQRPDEFEAKLNRRISEDTQFLSVSGRSGGYEKLLLAREQHDVFDYLLSIKCPCLVIAGEYDLQAPLEHQKAMAGRLNGAVYREYQGGHGVLFTCNRAQSDLMDWLHAL